MTDNKYDKCPGCGGDSFNSDPSATPSVTMWGCEECKTPPYLVCVACFRDLSSGKVSRQHSAMKHAAELGGASVAAAGAADHDDEREQARATTRLQALFRGKLSRKHTFHIKAALQFNYAVKSTKDHNKVYVKDVHQNYQKCKAYPHQPRIWQVAYLSAFHVRKGTIAWQLICLATSAYAFFVLWKATPYTGPEKWRLYAYLVTQHSGAETVTITTTQMAALVAGLRVSVGTIRAEDKKVQEEALTVCKRLGALGVVCGSPIIAVTVTQGWYGFLVYVVPSLVLLPLVQATLAYFQYFRKPNPVARKQPTWGAWMEAVKKSFRFVFSELPSRCTGIYFLAKYVFWPSTVSFAIYCLIVGNRLGPSFAAFELFMAMVVELIVPMYVLIRVVDLEQDKGLNEQRWMTCAGPATTNAFIIACCILFFTTMIIPMSDIARRESWAEYGMAPHVAFVGRRTDMFFKYFFFEWERSGHNFHVWLSQHMCFWT